MTLRNRLVNRANDGGWIVAQPIPIHFLRDDQALLAIDIDAKRRTWHTVESWVTMLDCAFNILRIMIASANDDEILQPSTDKDFAMSNEAEVAVRRNGPSPSARYPPKTSAVSPGRFQYPPDTLAPEIQTSPTSSLVQR